MEPVVNNLVEIIGPPGVGKSTLYYSTCQTWKKSMNWTYEDALLAPSRPKIYQLFELMEYAYKKAKGKRLSKSLPMEFGKTFSIKHQSLVEFLCEYLTGAFNGLPNQGYYRFRSSYLLFQDFSRYQAIFDKSSSLPCLLEEGFLQKSFLAYEKEERLDELLDRYLWLIPLPRYLIIVMADDDHLILKRIKERSKTSIFHVGKTDGELLKGIHQWKNLNFMIHEKFKALNIPVKIINGEESLETNVVEVKKVFEQIK